jgi:hypothetical protein
VHEEEGPAVLCSGTTHRRRKGEEADRLVISREEADRVGARKVEDRRHVLDLIDARCWISSTHRACLSPGGGSADTVAGQEAVADGDDEGEEVREVHAIASRSRRRSQRRTRCVAVAWSSSRGPCGGEAKEKAREREGGGGGRGRCEW